MPLVEYSNRDLKAGTVVEPAWYLVRIDSVGEEPTTTAKGSSINYPVEGTIIKNADNDSTEFAEVPIRWNFNSKAMGFSVGFLRGFGVEPVAGQRIDLAAAEGRYVEMFIGNKEYQGRTVHDVPHKYRVTKSS